MDGCRAIDGEMNPFLNEIRRRAGCGAFSATNISLSALQGDAGSIGAATLVVRQAHTLIDNALNRR